jgi:hypothetical protein
LGLRTNRDLIIAGVDFEVLRKEIKIEQVLEQDPVLPEKPSFGIPATEVPVD